MNHLTQKILDIVRDVERGLKVRSADGRLAPTGEVFQAFIVGRMLDGKSTITDDDLVKRIGTELRRYRAGHPMGKTIFWRERPEFHSDMCNGPARTLVARVAISDKEVVDA